MSHFVFRKEILLITWCCVMSACERFTHQDKDNDSTPAPSFEVSPIEPTPSDQQTPISDSSNNKETHLLFSAVDPLATPWQASLYALNLEKGDVSQLLSGESGDPAVFYTGGSVFFFNRYFDSKNFRRISLNPQKQFVVNAQTAFGGGDVGDPHDALVIGKNKLLLAHYIEGRINVIDPLNGSEIQKIEVDWDIPAGTTLKPENFVPYQYNGKTRVMLLSQGLTIQDGVYLPSGGQRAFILEVDGDVVRPIDLDQDTAGVQGIKLTGSFPLVLKSPNGGPIRFISICSRYIVEDAKGEKCRSVFEEIDTSLNTAKILWDLDGMGLYMNGPAVAGKNKDVFYASIDQRIEPQKFVKRVIRFDLSKKSYETIYDFAAGSGGFWGLFYSQTKQSLYVGDIGTNSVGRLLEFHEQKLIRSMDLKHVPYSGVVGRLD